MYFDLTEDQKAIRESVHSLLRDKLDVARTVQLFDAASLDRPLWTALMDLGLGSILVPADKDGLGLDMLTLSVVSESLGYYGAPAPVVPGAVAAWLLATSADGAQRERWLTRISSGQAVAAFALFEIEEGWLAADWRLTGPRLSGTKHFVEWGGSADLLIVGVHQGLAVIDSRSAGIHIEPVESLDRSRPLVNIRFDKVEYSLLHGRETAALLVDALLVLLAADACGAGMRAYELAVQYSQQRVQFGQIIGRFQALKHQLANMAVDMEPCRALYWYAAHAWDTLPEKRARAAATAKSHIGEVAVKTARMALECHGGIGYTWEYPLHVYLKRAMHSRIAMGLPSLHRERMAELAQW